MSPRARARSVLACLLLGGWWAAPAHAQEARADRVVIGARLERLVARDIQLDGESVRFRDERGKQVVMARAQVRAILKTDAGDEATALGGEPVWREISDTSLDAEGWLELVDGQVLPGKLVSSDSSGSAAESVGWSHDVLGGLWIPLERVCLVVVGEREGLVVPGAGSKDVVGLVNADRVEGFVARVGSSVEVESAGRDLSLGLDKVRWIRLANPARGAEGERVWLRSGAVLAVGSSRLTRDGRVRVSVGEELAGVGGVAREVELLIGDVTAINLDCARLVPLAGLSWKLVGEGAERLWTPPVRVGAGSGAAMGLAEIELPGPMSVEWSLPAGAERLAAVVELPMHARRFGDCELVVGFGDEREVWRERLHAGRGRVELNIAVPASARGVVRLTLEPGPSGPVQDVLVLHRAMVGCAGRD